MLLRFKVANYRSIRAEHELSLVATEFNEGTARPTGVRAEGRELAVLPVVGVFGANASGKSNVLGALRAMRDAGRSGLTGRPTGTTATSFTFPGTVSRVAKISWLSLPGRTRCF